MNAQTNQNPVSTIIAGVMRDATTEGNRQAALTEALFDDKANYTRDIILSIFRLSGQDHTEALDRRIRAQSEDFENAVDMLADLKDKKANERTDTENFQIEAITRKLRAARMMFKRALTSVFFAIDNNATKVTVAKAGNNQILKVVMPDDDGDPVGHKFTANAIATQGKKALDAALGKGKEHKARSPLSNSLADSSKALAAALTGLNGNGPVASVDLADDVQDNLDVAFAQLFRMHFADDKGYIDPKEVADFAKEMNAKAKEEKTADKKAA